MEPKGDELAPYYENGRLRLPEKAMELLAKAGRSEEIINAARTGLTMEEGHSIAEVSKAMEALLARIVNNPDIDIASTD